MSESDLAVSLKAIVKTFPGVIANYDVNLDVRAGSIHAIVGENGCGKSTLMKTLYGMHRPDSGDIYVHGNKCVFKSPADAIDVGVGMVHQHFMLADNLTVLENIILGSEPTTTGILDSSSASRKISSLAQTYGMDVDPAEMTENLGVGDRQRVEILKVLYRGASILILDEPTAVLVPHEVDELFANLKSLVAEGVTVVFISHKLDEVLSVADEITVMRSGTTVARVTPEGVTPKDLAAMMVGSELPSPDLRRSAPIGDPVLVVEALSAQSSSGKVVVDDVTLVTHAGEIVGIAGIEGNGQHELAEALLGLRSATGTITLHNDGGPTNLNQLSTRARREAGVAYIPFDRHREGLLLSAPLWENSVLGQQDRSEVSSSGFPNWLHLTWIKQFAREIITKFKVKTPSETVPALALSGGNQQKLIVGRELANDPKVLIAAHPTRGIDVGAQADVWAHLREARDDGKAIILLSADLEELIGLSDRLLVVRSGRIAAELDPAKITPQELGTHMTGAMEAAK